MYDVNELFKILKENKITTNIESVRRWLRNGTIEGIAPISRKEGWLITQESLEKFLANRLPPAIIKNIVSGHTIDNAINDEQNTLIIRNQAREDMWYELANKNIWEGYIEIKKKALKDAAEHRKYSDALVEEVWSRCEKNSSAYAKPRIFYLLDACGFERKRLLLDKNFASKEEQVVYAVFEHIMRAVKKEND